MAAGRTPSSPPVVHHFHSEGSPYFLASRADAVAGEIHLTLCDGTSTWSGALKDCDLTPPKRAAIRVEAFRERLLQGIRGVDGVGDVLAVLRHAGRDCATLRWSATKRDEDLEIELRLQQAVELVADILPGTGLRHMLGDLAAECARLEEDVRARCVVASTLNARLEELDGVVTSRMGTARAAAAADVRLGSFLEHLNRKKQRIADLDEALERIDQGGDAVNADAISEHGDDAVADDDDDIFETRDDAADAANAASDRETAGGSPSVNTTTHASAATAPSRHGLPAAQAPVNRGKGKAPCVVKVDPTDLYSALDDD